MVKVQRLAEYIAILPWRDDSSLRNIEFDPKEVVCITMQDMSNSREERRKPCGLSEDMTELDELKRTYGVREIENDQDILFNPETNEFDIEYGRYDRQCQENWARMIAVIGVRISE